jgi:hypothetical protein
VSNAAQTLLSFNIEAEKVTPVIRQIGDVSMGNGQKFGSPVPAFSRTPSGVGRSSALQNPAAQNPSILRIL